MDITPEHLKIVRDILKAHLPQNSTVFLFGSRLKKAKKKYSDLDLAVDAPTKLSLSTLASLAQDFSESDLPYKVDIVDLKNIDEGFLKHIQADMEIIFFNSL